MVKRLLLPTWERLEWHARQLGWSVSKIDSKRRFRKGDTGIMVVKIPAGWKIIYFRSNVMVDADIGSERAIKSLLYEHLGAGVYF